MHGIFFAHSGVDHATASEAAAHQSNTVLWAAAITLATIAVILTIIQTLSKTKDPNQSQEEENDT